MVAILNELKERPHIQSIDLSMNGITEKVIDYDAYSKNNE